MIGKLEGTFGGTTPDGSALIEVGGVGYSVRIPLAALQELRALKQKTLSLFIHTAVREDAIDLYGFKTQEELGFFKQLMSVKGVGPKTALSILNVADVKTLSRSIARGDASALTKVFGIGKKSAERIVVELRDKLAEAQSDSGVVHGPSDDGDVIEALIALGYSAQESRQALKSVPSSMLGVRERLAAALKSLGSSA
jgi:Holliday junction DNA helicase RuvA